MFVDTGFCGRSVGVKFSRFAGLRVAPHAEPARTRCSAQAGNKMGWKARIFYALGALYVAFFARELYNIFVPRACRHAHCLRSLLPYGTRVNLHAWLGDSRGNMVVTNGSLWSQLNVSSVEPLEARITIPVPVAVRRGEQDELWLHFTLGKAGGTKPPLRAAIATASINLLQRYPLKHRTASMLLEKKDGGGGARHEPAAAPAAVPAADVPADAPAEARALQDAGQTAVQAATEAATKAAAEAAGEAGAVQVPSL